MKIAIATMGRFYVVDIARELAALGEDVAFHTYAPGWMTDRYGLPRASHRALLPFLAPLVAWERKAPRLWPTLQQRLMARGLNTVVSARLQPCDVFIGMSGMYLEAADYARRKYGAKIVLERASNHIRVQKRMLQELGSTSLPSDYIIAREEAGYEMADRIAIPSSLVKQSFLDQAPHLADKLLLNPFGVDLEMFPTRQATRPDGALRVVMAGAWIKRKGVDLLEQAIRAIPGAHLTHCGPLGDTPFPEGDPQFTHLGMVPQPELHKQYAQADIFSLPSREDGFGVVISQALSVGLPVVCSTHTGAPDLRLTPELERRITLVAPGDAEALTEALRRVNAQVQSTGWQPLPQPDRDALSWSANGKRYQQNLQALMEG